MFILHSQLPWLNLHKKLATSLAQMVWKNEVFYTIGILCGYAIRAGRHPEGSQQPPGRLLLTSRGMSAWPYRVTTKYSFYPVRTYIRCWIKNNCANCALKWEIQWFDGELFIHTCMTSPAKLAVTCQVKPEARPSSCSISQGLHLAHKKPEYEYGICSIPNDKENHIKITSDQD